MESRRSWKKDDRDVGVLVDDASDRKSSEMSEPLAKLEKLTTMLEDL